MSLPIQLISTDFDGTLFAEFENPPVPMRLQDQIASLQSQGTRWIINTGRDLSSLLEGISRARLSIKPDFLVLVEREIYVHQGHQYVEHQEWNQQCSRMHQELFASVRADLPQLRQWIQQRFNATIYEDSYSPFCFIADRLEDADRIHEYLNEYCESVPNLMVMRNDVYARFCHKAFNKGSAMSEVGRLLGVSAENTFAAGDHLNDLPMLSREYARFLVAPHNAIDAVQAAVRKQDGFVSAYPCGQGVAEGLEYFLRDHESLLS
jgi:HAD superfamily hydrolase (TIGR01484 family)